MNEKSLEKNLANLERELVNLQTAHEVGLGTVKYYNYSGRVDAQIDASYYYGVYVLIEVNEGERINPFMELFVNFEANFASLLKNQSGTRYLINSYDIFEYTLVWAVVSTSMISWHYAYTLQEARDWLNG